MYEEFKEVWQCVFDPTQVFLLCVYIFAEWSRFVIIFVDRFKESEYFKFDKFIAQVCGMWNPLCLNIFVSIWFVHIELKSIRMQHQQGFVPIEQLRLRKWHSQAKCFLIQSSFQVWPERMFRLRVHVLPIAYNGVAPLKQWSCNPFSSNSTVFNENRIASVITELSQRWRWHLV